MNENSCCSLSSPPLGGVLDFGHSNRCVVVSHWFFNRQFPSDTWCWACFHMLKNSSAQSFCYFQLFATPWTATCQASLSITNSRACSNPCPSSRLCHPTILSSVIPFSFCLQSFLTSGSFPMVSSSHQVAKGLELQCQHQSFQRVFRIDFLQDGLVWSPCSPRDS